MKLLLCDAGILCVALPMMGREDWSALLSPPFSYQFAL